MLEQMTSRLDNFSNSLLLRSQRQQVIASNIANADTPGYIARDFDFAAALKEVSGTSTSAPLRTNAQHLSLGTRDPRDPAMASSSARRAFCQARQCSRKVSARSPAPAKLSSRLR